MVRKEAQTFGEPRTAHTQQRQEQREGQPLPDVWGVLERKVLLHAPAIGPARESPRWWKLVNKVSEQEEQLWKNGSDYDRAVLDLFTVATCPRPDTARTLTLKQFKQLRSDFEELSSEEIVEGKHQILQEMQQLRADVFQIFPQSES